MEAEAYADKNNKIIAGELSNAKNKVKCVSISIFWKYSNSPRKFKINTKLIIIPNT